ncbi:MAG: hypothetical protein ACC742_02485 [Thermoanaerobaculales bacterium]
MNQRRKLNALLLELQNASSPLGQAKVLARAWRTLRELSPTDRRLLARQAGFEKAEEMLEGLAARKTGWAPAMLLQVLGNAQKTDASTVSELIEAVGDPDRTEEALSKGADLAAELLAAPELKEGVGEASEEPGHVPDPTPGPASPPEEGPDISSKRKEEEPTGGEATPAPAVDLERRPGPDPLRAQAVDWSRWDREDPVHRPVPSAPESSQPVTFKVGAEGRQPNRLATDLVNDPGVLHRLRRLRRELPSLVGADAQELRGVVAAFPQGWARRRALVALLEGGIPADSGQAVELVAACERELDRRWCLGILARRGALDGETLARALDLLTSPGARRRLRAAAGEPA